MPAVLYTVMYFINPLTSNPKYARFEVLTVMSVRIIDLWDGLSED